MAVQQISKGRNAMPPSSIGTVLIGGGTGFIGTILQKVFRQKGIDYRVVSRCTGGQSDLSWSDIENRGLREPFDAVINVAGQNMFDVSRRWTAGLKENIRESRIGTTRILRDAIDRTHAEDKPKVFIAMNGVGYYKPSDTTKEYTEDSSGGNFDFLSELSAEWQAASKLRSSPNVRRVIIRSGGPVGNGKQYFPWIHVHDLVDLMIFCIENESIHGVLNGVAPQIITNKQFAQALGKAMRRPALMPMPKFVLNTIFSTERAKIMTEGQRVIPKRVLEYGFKFKYDNIDDACKECARTFYVMDNFT